MTGYFAFSWPIGSRTVPSGLEPLLQDAVTRGWLVAHRGDGFCLLLETGRSLTTRRSVNDDVWVLGDLFGRGTNCPAPPTISNPAPNADLKDFCAYLTTAYWGRYLVIQPNAAGAMAVFRDPSGALDCFTWRRDGIMIAASRVPDWLPPTLAPHFQVNWTVVRAFLEDPTTFGSLCGLNGVIGAQPGMIHWPSVEHAPTTVWRPASFARVKARPSPCEAKATILETVDACVAAFSATAGPMLAEVSGGLDSSIVASSLGRAPQARVVQWVNFHTVDLEGDERRYARALAGQLSFALAEIAKPELLLTDEVIDDQVVGVRPSLNGLDQHYDADLADRCSAYGARSIMTGQGGDIVFYQSPTPAVAVDIWRARSGRWSEFVDTARWTRRSVWSVLRATAFAASSRERYLTRRSPAFLSRDGLEPGANAKRHPWLSDLEGVAPAKLMQIRDLAQAQAFHGECRRGRRAELLHPLLSQPVVELCLSIPAIDLTHGGRGRALAREAFAHRLPDLIAQRRSKGDLTAYYGRMLARSLTTLRPYLLDGVVAGHGLIVRDHLDQMLTQEHLIWHGDHAHLLRLLAVETWARHWSRRAGASR